MFRAYDPARERLVAVKRFTLDLPPERVHRLVSAFEELIAAGLTHPALALPLATGIAGVSAFLVQEYVGAESLDLAVREHGAAAPADALHVAAQLASVLDAAAAASIVHGALHPRDILLSSDETRMTGIGVTRALAQVGVTAPVRRPYTAPQRIDGATWDRRADVFSLAALMHELLWGRRIAGLGDQAVESLTEIAGGDLAALRTTFARALAEDPESRFATALEFFEALQHACPGVSVAPAGARAKKRSARRPERVERAPRSEPAREVEPRLPLDGLSEPERGAAPAADFDLPLEPARFAAVDAAAVESVMVDVDVPRAMAGASPRYEPPATVPAGLITGDPEPLSTLERTRSAVWPLVLALGVGLAIGFGGGYFTGAHDRPAAIAVATPPAPAGGELTENSVPEAPKAVSPTPVPARPPPNAASANPESRIPNGELKGPGRLLIRSTPARASVTVDGREHGRTPIAIRELATGSHQVTVTRAGYAASDRRVVLTRAKPAQTVAFTLQRLERSAPATSTPVAPSARAAGSTPAAPDISPRSPRAAGIAGALTVESRPPGAKVFLDGALVGSTPLSLQTVGAGEHAVRIERDGYRRWSSQVKIVANEPNRITASLEK